MKSLPHTTERLYTADDVKLIERQFCQDEGVSLFELMQRAGFAAWQSMQQQFPEAETILIIAGAGNNAGDGFILACHAHHQGKTVKVLTVKSEPSYQGDAALAFELLQQTNIEINTFTKELLNTTDLVVDAILGTGLTGPLRDNYKATITAINDWREQTSRPVFSLDIPSGLNADTGTIDPIAIMSDHCLAFVNLKPGMVTGKAREFCPSWEVAELGVSDVSREKFPIVAYVDDAETLIHHLPKRAKTSHKGNHGHLLLIGGDDGFGGAILMATQAAARVGVGRFTIVTRDSHIAPFLTQFPEAMIRSVDDPMADDFQRLLETANAIVIGPGLGQGVWGEALLKATTMATCPIVIDADGLNHLANHKSGNNNWVLTPHPGEASRLLGCDVNSIESDRYQAVCSLQEIYQGCVILKGAGTLIRNNEQTTVCSDGNPGMATAGMGDILSGIVGSLLAQGLEPFTAARTAVALHAKAADLAAVQGEKGLLATDLLPPLRQLVNQ